MTPYQKQQLDDSERNYLQHCDEDGNLDGWSWAGEHWFFCCLVFIFFIGLLVAITPSSL